jgi:FtsZ-interacting cell division protein ZipA
MLSAIIVIVTIVVVVALVVWMWTTRRVPVRAATHGQVDQSRRHDVDNLGSPKDYAGPADPGAEAQRPVIGDAAPGEPRPDT